MRALLVQSPATSPWVPRRQWEPPSVGVATIAAQTDRHEVWIADLLVYRMAAPARLLEIIDEYCPQVVGFSSMTFQYHSTLELARMVKEHDGSILTALGGYHATLCHEQITSDKHEADLWDFLIRGEGDFAFGELLDCLDRGGAGLEQVRGLSFKRAGRFHHNPPRPAEDLTRIRLSEARFLRALYNWIIANAVTGFTTVILLLLITGSMLMIGLGVIGLYVSRIYDEVKGRPRYVVAEQREPS